ncbi:NAD(P)-binding domain-containing protein [Nocardia sp. NRRL S-836]|uniref:NAD(P)-binding domain-containing protein n=1 Tax=Nocardia sp. NRRL S-836 TaxID=1519492 RepID=UPI0006B02FD8|nr:NAD(P)-binding domain-containing protein [Nocardia sp. NRRL S-836]KOV82213.1 pyridine nucleotide-disulfide oxidoreductase [Nocardia sp. NRRL S-836]
MPRSVDAGVTDVVVIGAGQAGLSASYFLRKRDVDHVVLDANPAPGGAWLHRWPSLRMRTVHGIHELPGMPFEQPPPDAPANEAIPSYFARYEQLFDLPVLRPVTVTSVVDDAPLLKVETSAGTWTTRGLINATGTWRRPFWPHYPGQSTFLGRQLHTADYRGPEDFAGKRVVVVGGGASATQLLLELAPLAAATRWVTRHEPVWREGPFTEDYGRWVVGMVEERVRAGLIPRSVVSVTGLALTDQTRAAIASGVLQRWPMFTRITPTGVEWESGDRFDADVILWATGFRHDLDHLTPLRLRGPGGGVQVEGTRVVHDPRVHLVGYGPSASTIGANRAGRSAVRELVRDLGRDLGLGPASLDRVTHVRTRPSARLV